LISAAIGLSRLRVNSRQVFDIDVKFNGGIGKAFGDMGREKSSLSPFLQ